MTDRAPALLERLNETTEIWMDQTGYYLVDGPIDAREADLSEVAWAGPFKAPAFARNWFDRTNGRD